MRPIPHTDPAEGEKPNDDTRPSTRSERAETVDEDETWLAVLEF